MEVGQIIFDAFLAFILIFISGSFMSFPFRLPQSSPQKVFIKLTIGIAGIVIFTSIYCTGFHTINILFIPTIIFLFFKYRKKGDEIFQLKFTISRTDLKYLLLCFVTLLFIIFLQFYRLDYFNSELTYLSHADYSYYLAVAEYLFEVGVERVAPWYELNELSATGKVEAYHYGDLWLLGSILQLSKLASLKVFLYVFIPIVVTISISAILALFSSVANRKIEISFFILCVLLVFSIGGVPFLREAWGMHDSPLTRPKVLFFFVFMIIGLLALLKERFQLLVISICSIPIFHIVFAPAIFTTIFLWSFFLYLKIKKGEYIFGMIYPILITGGIISFYLFFGNLTNHYGGSSAINYEQYFHNFFSTIFRNILARGVVFHFILLLLAGIILKAKTTITENEKAVLKFAILFLGCTILFRGLFNFMVESYQIYHLAINPLFTILYVYIYSLFAKREYEKTKQRNFVFLLVGFQAMSSFFIVSNTFQQRDKSVSNEQLSQMSEALEGVNPIGVFITSPEGLNSLTVSATVCFFGEELKMMEKNKWVNSISVPENLNNFQYPHRIPDISGSPFYKFIQQQKEHNRYLSYEEAQRNFVEKYKVGYVWIEKGAAFPPELEYLSSKIIEDKKTGIRLGIFNKPQ